MALALLLDSWQGTDVRLAVRTIDAQKSRFASWVMAARPMEQRNQPIRLLMLVKDQQEALLGLVDAENGLTLAAQMGDIWDMLPERATWVNREDKCFRSPLPLLPPLFLPGRRLLQLPCSFVIPIVCIGRYIHLVALPYAF